MPSFSCEGFGFPASEAMACGLAVVANAAGALPEVVGTDGRAGRLVPQRDPRAIRALGRPARRYHRSAAFTRRAAVASSSLGQHSSPTKPR